MSPDVLRPVDENDVPYGPMVRASGREFVSVSHCSRSLRVAAVRVRQFCRAKRCGFSYIADEFFDENGERRAPRAEPEI